MIVIWTGKAFHEALEMNPVRENQRQGSTAHNHPQRESLQERADSNPAKGFLVQPGSNQEERYGQADFAEMIESAKGRRERRGPQRVQQGRQAEKQDEPGPLDARFALEHHRRQYRKGNDPKGAGEFN